MIPQYINDWFRVIENMKNENTYKLAWGRAIVECAYCGLHKENNAGKEIIELEDIAKCMLKYYWNQLFFFNLKQSPNRVDKRQPYVVQYTFELIEVYRQISGSFIPVWFDKASSVIDKANINKTIKKIASILPNDVSWRFKEIDKQEIPLYIYDNRSRSNEVIFEKESIELLKEYAVIISKLLNYKWSQLLERFNYSPKIVSKVNSISDAKLKRNSLLKYKNELMNEFEDGIARDFYTGEPLNENDISVDHVIPWSFMYSDDIWNLVLTSKRNNSIKSNSIPEQETIDRLKERNKFIADLLDDKYSMEMKDSIDNNYVDKFYFECRM